MKIEKTTICRCCLEQREDVNGEVCGSCEELLRAGREHDWMDAMQYAIDAATYLGKEPTP